MKGILIAIKQLPTGMVSVDVEGINNPSLGAPTAREEEFAVAIKAALAGAIPKLAERLGAARTISGQSPTNGN
jgi:hypothetical protein